MAVSTETIKSGDILGGMGVNFAGFNFGTLTAIIVWVIGIIIVGGILAVIIVWYINKRSYNLKIWVFSRIGGLPMLKLIDRGKLMAFGMAGDRLLQMKKTKKFLPVPQIQMGKNIYWFYEREDGEYINFSLTDIDNEQKKAGAYYVDTDMRMQRLGIEKNLTERLTKLSFFEKYGTAIAGVIFVIMVTVSLVVLFSQLKDVTASIDGMAKSVSGMATEINNFYTARVGGESPRDVSGLIPAFAPLLLLLREKKWLRKL